MNPLKALWRLLFPLPIRTERFTSYDELTSYFYAEYEKLAEISDALDEKTLQHRYNELNERMTRSIHALNHWVTLPIEVWIGQAEEADETEEIVDEVLPPPGTPAPQVSETSNSTTSMHNDDEDDLLDEGIEIL